MERIYRSPDPVPEWLPHEYLLKTDEDENDLPTEGIPAGSTAYKADWSAMFMFDGESWVTSVRGE